ncbi:MAG: SET domain-containing protein-lysine N-methyltransferase [Nanoarchaeota archaeon]
MSYYRPLPEGLTIRKSEYLSNITGSDELGLFATKKIDSGVRWMTHVRTDDPIFEDGLIRLPMGGFFNHNSKNPNCEVIHEEDYIFLQTLREIEIGEELTAKYTIYDPEEK